MYFQTWKNTREKVMEKIRKDSAKACILYPIIFHSLLVSFLSGLKFWGFYYFKQYIFKQLYIFIFKGARPYHILNFYSFRSISLFSIIDIIKTYIESKRELKRLQNHCTWDQFFSHLYIKTKKINYDFMIPVKFLDLI